MYPIEAMSISKEKTASSSQAQAQNWLIIDSRTLLLLDQLTGGWTGPQQKPSGDIQAMNTTLIPDVSSLKIVIKSNKL